MKHKCLHCEIEKLIDKHIWVGEVKYKKLIIIKDLLQVLYELIFFKKFH